MDITQLKTQYRAGERNFRGAQLSSVNLAWVDLTGIDLQGVDLSHANLSGVNLGAANLSGDTNLTFADLSRADLRNANLKGTRLEGANLEGIQMEGAVYDEVTKFPFGFNPKRVGAISSGKPTDTLDKNISHAVHPLINSPQLLDKDCGLNNIQTLTLTPNPSPRTGEGSKNLVPLLSPCEKVLGNEELQSTSQLSNSLGYLIHDPKQPVDAASSNKESQSNSVIKNNDVYPSIEQWSYQESDRNNRQKAKLNSSKHKETVQEHEARYSANVTSGKIQVLKQNTKLGNLSKPQNQTLLRLDLKDKSMYLPSLNALESKDNQINYNKEHDEYLSNSEPLQVSVTILLIGAFSIFMIVLGFSHNQSMSDSEIDLGVTSEDISFGVTKTKTYTHSMEIYALLLNKGCIEQDNKDSCKKYKRLYDTFLNGGRKI